MAKFHSGYCTSHCLKYRHNKEKLLPRASYISYTVYLIFLAECLETDTNTHFHSPYTESYYVIYENSLMPE